MECVDFHPFSPADQAQLKYAVVVSLHQGRWLFVKHRERETLEIPAGRREPGEEILRTANRELFEETGATRYQLVPLTTYSVDSGAGKSYGLLCFAHIEELGPIPSDSEIEKVVALENSPVPRDLTYPTIQPALFTKALRMSGLYRRIVTAGKKHVVFDWNGTLLDDTAISVEVIGSLLREYGLPSVSLEEYRSIFCFPVIDYYRKLGFDFRNHTFESVGDQFIARYRERIAEAQLFDGAAATLKLLSKRGFQLSILSAAAQHHLEEATRAHGIHPWLDQVYGIDNHYAASKLERGRELLRNVPVAPADTLMVGDTDHDLEVGRALGLDVLLVADGHQQFERLKKLHQNTIATRFEST